jgi:hypothetical protein
MRRSRDMCRLQSVRAFEQIAVLTDGFSKEELTEAGAITVFESVSELCAGLGYTPLDARS